MPLFKHYSIFPHIYATDEEHQALGCSTLASRISALLGALTWINLHKDSCMSLQEVSGFQPLIFVILFTTTGFHPLTSVRLWMRADLPQSSPRATPASPLKTPLLRAETFSIRHCKRSKQYVKLNISLKIKC